MKVANFRPLKVRQVGKKLALDVYRVTRVFPNDELYGMTSQTRRAAESIPSNIAEGVNRLHAREYRRFLYLALGSCAELETQIEVAGELGYLALEQAEQLLEQLDHESTMLRSLIKTVHGET